MSFLVPTLTPDKWLKVSADLLANPGVLKMMSKLTGESVNKPGVRQITGAMINQFVKAGASMIDADEAEDLVNGAQNQDTQEKPAPEIPREESKPPTNLP